ncbi:hypothetical protein GGI07_001542 [Coemansia sp. Benny D115]|nr:hypothetical protein GGI07_001542 [Coemansia sp. Benny D115]
MPSVIPAALAKALTDKFYDKQRTATLKIERLVLDALDVDDEQKIYSLIAELSTDYATSEKEAARIGGLVALAATAVALTHINIRPFLPHMVPPMVSALSDGESKVRYFACESLYNVAKVSRGHILRWFNDIFDGLARVTADSVKTVKDGADYLDRLIKDIVAEQAATCLDWYENSHSDDEADGGEGAPKRDDETDYASARDHADGASFGAGTASGLPVVLNAPRRGSIEGATGDAHPTHEGQGQGQAQSQAHGHSHSHDKTHGRNRASSTGNLAEAAGGYLASGSNAPGMPMHQAVRKGPRLAFSLEKFMPLLYERMHTYKPSTRLYLIEWVRLLDSVPGLDLIVHLPDFLDGLLRFLSDPSDDVRNRTQSLLGELLSEIHECVELQAFGSDEDGPLLASDDDFADDGAFVWGEPRPSGQKLSKARVRSSTMQSDVHVEGRFAADAPRYPLGIHPRHQNALSRMPSRAPSAAGSISGTRMGGQLSGPSSLAPFYQNHPANRPHSRAASRSHLHARSGSSLAGDTINRSTASIMSSALAAGQLHGVSDELRMAARRKKIRAERAGNAMIPGAAVVIDFARCIETLIPHLESNDQEIQGTALMWILHFAWLCPQITVQFVPRLVNAVLPSVSHPIPTHRRAAEDINLQLFELVEAGPDPVRRQVQAADIASKNVDAQQSPLVAPLVQPPQPQPHLSSWRETSQWAASVPGEHVARPAAARPLPPVTSTTTAAVGSLTRPQSPSLSSYSMASGGGPSLAVRSRAGSLLQATTGSPAPSSAVATPAMQPADMTLRTAAAAASKAHSRPQSPPLPPTQLHPAIASTLDAPLQLNTQADSPTPNLGPDTQPAPGVGHHGAQAPAADSSNDAGSRDAANEVVAADSDCELPYGSCAAPPTRTFVIDEPFNYDLAATAIMELFAKNVHEPTKVAGMQWLLLLHRKAPWRILMPQDMSFSVLLKMLSDSSEQVVKLDLELFAQISLYSQRQQPAQLAPERYYAIDPRSTPYLSRFLGSLLQMFATDRVLLETRAALMIRQLCVVLDPQLVFCLFSRLLALPQFSIDQPGHLATGYEAKRSASRSEEAHSAPTAVNVLDQNSGADAGDRANENHCDTSTEDSPTTTGPDQETSAADSSATSASANRTNYAAPLSAIEEQPSSASYARTEQSDVSEYDHGDSETESVVGKQIPAQYAEYGYENFGEDQFAESPAGAANAYSSESLVDLEFISVMVQHLSWILVTAPETEKLRRILRQYSVDMAGYNSAPKLASVHEAIASLESRPASRDTSTQGGATQASSGGGSAAERVRRPRSSTGPPSGVRRRGASSVSAIGGTGGGPGPALAKDAPGDASAQQKPTKLTRTSTGASNAISTTGPSGKASNLTMPALPTGGASLRGSSSAAQPGIRSSRNSVSEADKPRTRVDKGARQQQQQQQAALVAQRAGRVRRVLTAAVDRIQQDIVDNRHSHGLFTSLFRTWSHNPAACLTLCLLSQHYEIGAELITAFGQLTQDLTVSFLVQLDKLVQLIESPVFTYLRLQLLDPVQYPLLVRTLYGLLMMLPQSSAFAILRNRLSTISMLPSVPGFGGVPQRQNSLSYPASTTLRSVAAGSAQDVDASGLPRLQQEASHYHYHYHYHSHPLQQQHPANYPGASSVTSSSRQAVPGVLSGGDLGGGSVGAGGSIGQRGAATAGLLSNAVGISPADLHELVQLLTVSSKQQQNQHPLQPIPLGTTMPFSNGGGGDDDNTDGAAYAASGVEQAPSATRILQQLAELQLFAVSPAESSVGLNDSCRCNCHGLGSGPMDALPFGLEPMRSAMLVDSQRMRLMDEYRAVSALTAKNLFGDGRQRPLFEQHHQSDFALSSTSGELVDWITNQDSYARSRILANIAPFNHDPSAMPGAVCASPSQSRPDYYYSWTRDSALVMNEILSWVIDSANSTQSNILTHTIEDYISFTRHVQNLPNLKYGLAEAKFNMDGTPFTKNWCNGQTDGPAIRAYMLTRYARYLLDRGRDVRHLYNPRPSAKSPIKTDLDYVASVWMQNQHCDIWEEARGLHFYTVMAQRRALVDGAQLARILGDSKAGKNYEVQAERITRQLLPRFWDKRRGHVLTTIDWSGGLGNKYSNLDSQVLLASLHSGLGDGVYTVESQQMSATVLRLLKTFEPMYQINNVLSADINGAIVPIGVAAGRYPEDVYNGVGTSRGNPWSLITSALAEYHYRLATSYTASNQFTVTRELIDLIQWTSKRSDSVNQLLLSKLQVGNTVGKSSVEFHELLRYLLNTGDLYMARVYFHTARDHTMYEQWYSYNGYGRGAIHLTWSYAAHTAASRARAKLLSAMY